MVAETRTLSIRPALRPARVPTDRGMAPALDELTAMEVRARLRIMPAEDENNPTLPPPLTTLKPVSVWPRPSKEPLKVA
ncbi:hypothetical protein D3C72_2059160 [compost metagenome]